MDIQVLFRNDWKCEICHIPREANFAADAVAKLGHSLNNGEESCPTACRERCCRGRYEWKKIQTRRDQGGTPSRSDLSLMPLCLLLHLSSFSHQKKRLSANTS
ncbi:hypothetical protein LINGRAHAP2_LOCUS12522 [Linum grandiflorum]